MAKLAIRAAKNAKKGSQAKGSGGKKSKARAAARGAYSGQSSGGGNSDVPF